MATLPQRFKLLATRCAAGAPSPSRSPAPGYAAGASPGYRLRRRRGPPSSRRRGSLRRFLCRRGGGGGAGGPDPLGGAGKEDDDRKPLFGGRAGGGGGGRTLRDLFVASPEAGRRGCGCDCDDSDDEEEEVDVVGRVMGPGRADPGNGGGAAWVGSRRFGGAGGLRSLLLRRSWRPVLVAIPEADGGGGKVELGAIAE